SDGTLTIEDGTIVSHREGGEGGLYIAPGFIDLHVHGGDGADFMDGDEDAFRTVCRAHVRHGTTALLATSTAGTHEQVLRFLRTCRALHEQPTGGAIVAGAHLYGPHFHGPARGCHPASSGRGDDADFLAFADVIRTATVAPEVPGAEAFARACAEAGIALNAGHSHCTWEQIEAAMGWGVSHVDHLFCAMSDRARLRQTQTYPMRGGLMEATLFFDDLTTEVIADGKHLAPELLRLAYVIKGPDRLALVTDANRALDMPDGDYLFGPRDGGEPIIRKDGVGLMPDGLSLASGVMGMDHLVRHMLRVTFAPLHDVIRMATLTPARIAGLDDRGTLSVGMRADLVLLDDDLNVRQVWIAGEPVWTAPTAAASG
ncbi:MAG: N-acetylglucosamine-6-phosphate deacetylase, partial [Gemmataceae bacterium]